MNLRTANTHTDWYQSQKKMVITHNNILHLFQKSRNRDVPLFWLQKIQKAGLSRVNRDTWQVCDPNYAYAHAHENALALGSRLGKQPNCM